MAKTKVERSGVLPYYLDGPQIQILFMRPSNPKYGGDVFQMAKGKVEEGEEPKQAGLREGQEELGLFKGNIIHDHYLGKFLGRTYVYVLEVKDPDMFGDPHYETEETRWMTPDEFQSDGRGLHKPVVNAAVRYITKRHEQELNEAALLLEMPHISIQSGPIDLQLELQTHLDKEGFIQYIVDLLSGKPLKSKYPSVKDMSIPEEHLPEFAQKLLSNEMFRLYILKKYDRETVYKVEQMLTNAVLG